MQDLTHGSVTRHLLQTTSFMLVTMVFQTLYFLVDLYWVGRLGKEAVVCNVAPAAMIGFFSSDAYVVRTGVGYLRIVSLSFVASGLVFVSSSMFQALGNTVPPLVSSFGRIVVVGSAAALLARQSGFDLRWIWYISATGTVGQMAMNLLLLRSQFRQRLEFERLVA